MSEEFILKEIPKDIGVGKIIIYCQKLGLVVLI